MKYFEFFRKLDKLNEDYLTEGKNLEKTIQMYTPRFRKYLNNENSSDENIKQIIEFFIELDPTYKKGSGFTGDYGTWIMDRYLKKPRGFDLLGVTNLLKDFINVKQALPNKDINAYKSLDDLRNAVNSAELSDRQKERKLRNSKDYKIVYQDNDWTIYVPTTYAGSCTLGKGTEWCTAYSDDDSYYKSYTEKGPLYIIINNHDKSEKYQFHFETRSFMDADDYSINKKDFYKDNPSIYNFFIGTGKEYDANRDYIYDSDGEVIDDSIAPLITSVKVSDSVKYLPNYCFSKCESLEQITIPNSIESIGKSCFLYCACIEKIILPNSVTSIGSNCFEDCSSLKEIYIPNSVTFLGDACFAGCVSLEEINITGNIKKFGTSLFNYCSSLKKIDIPESVVEIGNFCFQSCLSLNEITIPKSVTYIGYDCFYNCESLQQIRVKKGSYAHQYCIEEGLEDKVVLY